MVSGWAVFAERYYLRGFNKSRHQDADTAHYYYQRLVLPPIPDSKAHTSCPKWLLPSSTNTRNAMP